MVRKKQLKAFTLVEILVVLAIIATLLSVVSPRFFHYLTQSKETTLKHDLNTMREAIDKFYSDRNTYPNTLEELVQYRYLRSIPPDPITDSNLTWIITPPADPNEQGAVADIYSGSAEIAEDGTAYATW
jgi:general secretion pathway protein G